MAKDTTSKKEKSEKKQGNKIVKWFKDLRIEFKKVVWPTKETVVNNTSVVLGVIVASAVFVGLLDDGIPRTDASYLSLSKRKSKEDCLCQKQQSGMLSTHIQAMRIR